MHLLSFASLLQNTSINESTGFSSFARYADLLGETKELLRNEMPTSKIVFYFNFSLFGMFAIEFFMKVKPFLSNIAHEASY